MTRQQKFRNLVVRTAIAASLLCGAPDTAKADSTEVMVGNVNTTLDVKVGIEVAPRTNLFFRNRTTVDYDNQVSYFGLVDLSYNLTNGLDILAESQFIQSVGAVPRLGLQYSKEFGDLSIYGSGIASIGNSPDGEFLVNLRYTPNLSGKLKGIINLENITNIGGQGHNFSTQRVRLGLGIGKFELGLATDIETNGNVSHNVGVYGKMNF